MPHENIFLGKPVSLVDHLGHPFGSKHTNNNLHAVLVNGSGIELASTTSDSGATVFEVHEEHAHHRAWNHYFTLDTAISSTLNGTVAINTKTLILNDATGFIVGEPINILSDSSHIHMYRKIINIVSNTLTLDSNIDFALPNGSTIIQTSFNMAVDGSVTPQIFTMIPAGTENIDITRLLFEIIDGTAGDDSKFGGIAGGITNGIHLRKNTNNTAYQTIAIWNKNQEMVEDMFNLEYTDKAGLGNYGVKGRWSLLEGTGAIINLDAASGEFMECIVQDDLTPLIDFEMKMQGHFESE